MIDAIKKAEFGVWDSIIEHRKQGAPDIIIEALLKVQHHLQEALRILNEGDEL